MLDMRILTQKPFLNRIVAQVYGSLQLAKRMAGPIDSISSRICAETLEYGRGATPALFDRGDQSQQLVPGLANGFIERRRVGQHRLWRRVRRIRAARAEADHANVEARAQIEA